MEKLGIGALMSDPFFFFFTFLSLCVPRRCVVGDDWWYYGDRCQHEGSTTDKNITALAASLSVLAAMLIVTVVSVICVKRKYKKRSGDIGMTLSNVSVTGRSSD